uniref:Uncharacterized protein n=1 Tax=Poecilia latipinna TaxID=48699 RepID=A0A3B3UX24_9TELE
MTLPTVRQLFLLCLLGIFGCLSTTDASLFGQWLDDTALRKVRGVQSDDMSNVLWRDQNEVSRHHNRSGLPERLVHPLMRLSPKLSQRRKKKVLLVVRKVVTPAFYLFYSNINL